MSKTVRILSTRQVEDVNAVTLRNATLDGHGPVSGIFEIWDADFSFSHDEDGVLTATVICRLGNSQEEEPSLKLKCPEPLIHICEGFYGEVVDALEVV